MPTRVTPSALTLPRLRQGRAVRRRVKRADQHLARALAGDFGAGVQADVLAAQNRTAA